MQYLSTASAMDKNTASERLTAQPVAILLPRAFDAGVHPDVGLILVMAMVKGKVSDTPKMLGWLINSSVSAFFNLSSISDMSQLLAKINRNQFNRILRRENNG